MRRVLLVATLLVAAAGAGAAPADFPSPPSLQPAVRFWTRIYTEVGTDGALIHDVDDLDVVYERVDFPDELGGREVDSRYAATKEKYRDILRTLAGGKRTDLTPDEERVLKLFPPGVSGERLRTAADSVRLQRGQANRFREGLVRSGAWAGHIERTLQRKGLPAEIVTLPHVESSYNPEAYSKVGAAGLWQFMPSTGRLYMRVDNVVDERMDPWKATEAAAELLRHNHDMLGTWPLALTAYNHGAGGLARAVRALGTNDIAEIVRRWDGAGFGFASRNFYTSFLAAHESSQNADRYFGPVRRQAPVDYRVVRLDKPFSVKTIQNALGVDLETIREHNLALRDAFWSGRRPAPAGITLRVPKKGAPQPENALALARADGWRPGASRPADPTTAAPPAPVRAGEAEEAPPVQTAESAPPEPVAETPVVPRTGTVIHTVRGGETVYSLARRYGVDASLVMGANRLRDPRALKSGMRLRIPAPVVARVEAPEPPEAPAAEPTPGSDIETAVAVEPVDAAPAPASDPEPETLGDVVAALQIAEDAAQPVEEAVVAPADVPETTVPDPGAPPVHDAPAMATEAGEDEAPLGSPLARASRPARSAPASPPTPARASRERSGGDGAALPRVALDRSRYRVGANNTITIQSDESLARVAKWSGTSVERLRTLNKLSAKAQPGVGKKLRVDLSKVPKARFEERRIAYHQALRDDFFESFEVAGTQLRTVKKGDTLQKLTRGGTVPVWLLRHYNPDVNLDALRPGKKVKIPKVEKKDS